MLAIAAVALIVLGIAQGVRAERLLLARWRVHDRRGWAGAMRATRRTMPFRLFARYTTTEMQLGRWSFARPEWMREDPLARAALRRMHWWAPLLVTAGMFTLFVFFTACSSAAPRTKAAEDIRVRSAAAARAESAGDAAQALTFWTSTAVVQLADTPAMRGRAEIEQMYRASFPTLVALWNETHEVRVAESGELAYEIGTQHLTTRENDPLKIGIKQSSRKYLAIWTRGADGVWRVDAMSITRNP